MTYGETMPLLTPEQITAYLNRLGLQQSGPPNLGTLNTLQLAHQRHIPFENLNIHLGRPMQLDLPTVYCKVVQEKRGGTVTNSTACLLLCSRRLSSKWSCIRPES